MSEETGAQEGVMEKEKTITKTVRQPAGIRKHHINVIHSEFMENINAISWGLSTLKASWKHIG